MKKWIHGSTCTDDLKSQIIDYCNTKSFKGMDDFEIYDWLCDNFYCDDYTFLRDLSFNLKSRDN